MKKERKKAMMALKAGALYWLVGQILFVILESISDRAMLIGSCLYIIAFAPVFIAIDRWNYSDDEEES